MLYAPPDVVVGLLRAVAGRHLGGARGIFRSAWPARSVLQCRGQRLAPAVRPNLPPDRLAEEERIVSHLAAGDFAHERFAVRSLLARLGLPADVDAFSGAALPISMTYHGILGLSMEEFLKPPRPLRQLFRPFVKLGTDHALVFLCPGHGYHAFSTLALAQAGVFGEAGRSRTPGRRGARASQLIPRDGAAGRETVGGH
jgi:hypothetical protein